jgi:hypothetical protein
MNQTITTVRQFLGHLRSGPFTSVGSYPLFFVLGGSDPICFAEAKRGAFRLARAIRDKAKWAPTHIDVNWESPELYCEHTGERIVSAYAEPESDQS